MDVSSDIAFSQDAALSPWERYAVCREAMSERALRRQQHRHSPREPDWGAVPQSPVSLTPREQEVLCLLALRLSAAEERTNP